MFIFNKKFFLIIILFFTFNTTFSQNSEFLNIKLSPQNPTPNENVNIELNSYSINLDTSKISWYINNTLKNEGVGETKNTIKVGGIEKTTNIKIIVTEKNGTKTESLLKIKPSSASLVVEPFSYTPIFYRGKSTFTYEGSGRLVVFPEITDSIGKKISVENLIFEWSEDSILRKSGVGKNYYDVETNIPVDEIYISVKIYTLDKTLLLSTSKIIKPDHPKTFLYENNPLYGILYNKSLPPNYFLGDKEEIQIISEPFFFNKDISNLEYKWSINNEIINQKEEKNQLILKRTDNNSRGKSNILLNIKSNDKIFQSTKNNLYITYGQQ